MEGFVLVIFQILVVLFSIVIHEVSHGLMAFSLGDQTAKNARRLTLNPLPHLDIFGSVLLPLLTYSFGGFIFGYAKPVPYNPLYLKDLPELFSFIVLINLILAIFNLLPVPPLDGHWLLLSAVPDRFYGFKSFYLRYGLILFILVLIFVLPLVFPLVFQLFRLIVG